MAFPDDQTDLFSDRVAVVKLDQIQKHPMSWSELERLVDDAESDASLRRGLRRCRSRRELVMATRRLGYGIQPQDLWNAWRLEQRDACCH